jgi:uncharacterized membrane protein YphA (DoxX/SURF4 family)
MGRCTLQRLFSAFPGGPPGSGLLILRAATGATLAAQGISFFLHPQITGTLLVAGVLLTATGVFILIGFLMPIVSLLATVECLSMVVYGITLPHSLFSSKLVAIQAAAIFVAMALLGPGAFSVDARLFGWKEIVIPAAPHKPQE